MSFLKTYALELTMFFTTAGLMLCMNGSRTAVYDRICYGIAAKLQVTVNCHNLTGAPEALHDGIREENTKFNTWDTVSQTVTPSLAGLLLSARGDRIGRKQNFIFGLSSTLLIYILNGLVLSTDVLSVYTIPIGAMIFGCGGTFSLAVNSAMQHVSDTTSNPSERTAKTARLMSVLMLSFTAGGLLASYLLKAWTYTGMVWLAAGMCATGLVLAAFCIENIKPKENPTGPLSIGGLLTDIWHMVTKSRPNNGRFYLHLAIVCWFLGAPAVETTGPVITLYTFETPISLSPQQLGMYMALGGITETIGSLVGSKTLAGRGWHETDLILLSTGSKICEYLAIAAATSSTMLFGGRFLGVFGMLMRSAYQTLFSELVDSNEVGKVTALTGLALDTARLTLGLALNLIYMETAKYLKSAVFLFMAGLAGISFAFMLRMKAYFAVREKKQ